MLDPLKTSSYDYDLPKELIATHPVSPTDSARLLVYNRTTQTITHTTFKHLMDFYHKIYQFLNDTKIYKKLEFLEQKNRWKNRIIT